MISAHPTGDNKVAPLMSDGDRLDIYEKIWKYHIYILLLMYFVLWLFCFGHIYHEMW